MKKSKARPAPARRKPAVPPSYQEGSVETVGGGPSGTDRDDRSGDGTEAAGGGLGSGHGRDAFVSSEVGEKTSRPGKDPRTRS